jgi:hypothetical protein
MDPNQALQEMLDALGEGQWATAVARAESLREWLERRGAAPSPSPVQVYKMVVLLGALAQIQQDLAEGLPP